MEAYKNFDEFQLAQPVNLRPIIAELRKFVSNIAPDLDESVKWGNGCWINNKLPVIYVHCKNEYVQFGFYGGSLIDDPIGLLEGEGKYVRYIVVNSINDINEAGISPIIKQAKTLNYR